MGCINCGLGSQATGHSTTRFRLVVKSAVNIRFSVRTETMPRSPAVVGLQKDWQEERYPAEQFLS